MNIKKVFIFSIFLFIFYSCENEENNLIGPKAIGKVDKKNEDRIENAISFLNENFKSNLMARGLNLKKYSNKEVDTIYKLKDENKTVLKLICFNPKGYVLISDIEKVPNPPVLFYSPEKLDAEDVNPVLINYIQEFLITHSEETYAPPPGDDENDDGAWDDGRDTNTGDPRDSPYYHTETVIKKWTETEELGPLMSTFWRQGKPYSKTIEKFEGEGTAVGCVAIASGQIMNYNRKNNLKNYDWNKINVNDPTTDYLPDFLRDVAEGVHMTYGSQSSSNIGKAVDYFRKAGYSAESKVYNYHILKNMIKQNKPVFISASNEIKKKKFLGFTYKTKYKGHAWVADGYRDIMEKERIEEDNGNKGGGVTYYDRNLSSSLFVHMNWGWGQISQIYNSGGWCTYNYFKTRSFSEFKYKKRMMTY